MDSIEERIRNSVWWKKASEMDDRHPNSKKLSDHLNNVLINLQTIFSDEPKTDYLKELNVTLERIGLSKSYLLEVFTPVALLHDIGKIRDDEEGEMENPITGIHFKVKKRHPLISLVAAFEILPPNFPNLGLIFSLIEHHDVGYGWYRQFEKNKQIKKKGQIPGKKSWNNLDNKIFNKKDGAGLILLSLFKLADIDGHDIVKDVVWFFEEVNKNCLVEKNKKLPVPNENDVKLIQKMGNVIN